MSKNLVKIGYFTMDQTEKKVIASNDLIAKKLGIGSYVDPAEAFQNGSDDLYAGEDGETMQQLDGLLLDEAQRIDPDDPDAHVIGYQSQDEALLGEDVGNTQDAGVSAMNEQAIAEAQEQIEQMRADALAEIEALKASAVESAKEEGRSAGYQEGYAEGFEQAKKELEAQRNELRAKEAEMDAALKNTEPLFVDTLTKIYEHVFHTDLSDDREIIIHLLDTALHGIESGKEFLIRVSKEDYPFVTMSKKRLLQTVSSSTIEIVEDLTLQKNQCLIETDGGIFDCSIDVELFTLAKNLKLLAYHGNES